MQKLTTEENEDTLILSSKAEVKMCEVSAITSHHFVGPRVPSVSDFR